MGGWCAFCRFRRCSRLILPLAAPVHSIAAALFLDRNEVHFFHDIGCELCFLLACSVLTLLSQIAMSPSVRHFLGSLAPLTTLSAQNTVLKMQQIGASAIRR